MPDDSTLSTILQRLKTLELRLADWEERHPDGRLRYEPVAMLGAFDGRPIPGICSATTVPIVVELKEILAEKSLVTKELRRQGKPQVAIERFCEKVRQESSSQLLKISETPMHSVQSARLSDRERRIWAIIERGLKGRQYCRELDNAGIAPTRTGVWKDCPRTYLAAYDLGQTWRHRIEDEKSKIRRKAGKLAGALAGE